MVFLFIYFSFGVLIYLKYNKIEVKIFKENKDKEKIKDKEKLKKKKEQRKQRIISIANLKGYKWKDYY